jgi:restriction system protein
MIVQCKKYREDRRIGEPTIKQLHADVRDRNASKGLLVTSSCFSRDAKKYIDLYKYKLAGKDFDGLLTWIENVRRSHNS